MRASHTGQHPLPMMRNETKKGCQRRKRKAINGSKRQDTNLVGSTSHGNGAGNFCRTTAINYTLIANDVAHSTQGVV